MPVVDMSEAQPQVEEYEEDTPPSPKQQIKQEEIFMGLKPETPVEEPIEKEDKPIKTDKVKTKKKRPPMTEEHKEKLKKAREKALETRRKNAREKKELKELQKLKKQKELEDLRAEVKGEKKPPKVREVIEEVKEYKPPPAPAPAPAPPPTHIYTKEDLLKAQQEAVLSYEKARQYKKKLKREEEEIIKQNEMKVVKAVSRVRQTPKMRGEIRYGDPDYWDNCF